MKTSRILPGLAAAAWFFAGGPAGCDPEAITSFAPCGRFYCEAENQFAELAASLDGEYHEIDDTSTAGDLTLRILESRLENGADVVLLIDKTGSMGDDIGAVKAAGTRIVGLLGTYTDVRLAVGFYGDSHYDGKAWYVMPRLSGDHQAGVTALANVTVEGGGDVPESVYDAIAKTLDDLNWRAASRKLLIVIGDAPSHTGSRSEHSLSELQAKAAAKGALFTIFPILSSPF